jgi:hypothetical protein
LRIVLLELFPAAQLREDLFLRFFADRAGIDQDDIRFSLVVGQVQAMGWLEHVGHLGRVVLVHLASVGLYVSLPGMESALFKAWRPIVSGHVIAQARNLA